MKNMDLEDAILDYLISTWQEEKSETEDGLSRHFGVSPTPVREALISLERRGFVERKQKKGTSLKSFSVRDFNEMYDLRSVMEGLAARLMCRSAPPEGIEALRRINGEYEAKKEGRERSVLSDIDYRFHMFIMEASSNRRLVAMVKDFHIISKTFSLKMLKSRYVSFAELNNPFSHRRIIDEIEKGDPESAELVMKKHVETAKDSMLGWMMSSGRGLGADDSP